jgi:tetratricopeptide (TPR) repeat protein
LPYIATVLGVLEDELINPMPDPLRVAHEWLVSDPPQSVEIHSGRRVGVGLASRVEARVIELRHLDDQLGGEDLAPVVVKELDASSRLVRSASFTEPVGRRLLTAVGELAQLAGWVASDAGLFQRAEVLYLSGVSAAVEAGNKPLAGNLLSSLSYQMANAGKSSDALLLARTAAKGADGSPIVRSLLMERVAWAAAKSGEASEALRTLDHVDAVYEARRPGDEEPEWTYWLSRDEVNTMRARVLVEIGRAAEAGPVLTDVLSRYPAEAARESALYWSWLAEAHVKAGEFDEAQVALVTARKFAARVHSHRANTRVAAVAEAISRS